MRATHGTAIYTGGGIYVAIGELDNGYWFYGGNDFCSIFDEDTRTYNSVEDGLACFWNDWCVNHEVKSFDIKEIYEMFEDFCRRLDAKEPGITDGYEEYSNYVPGEVTDYIDFSEFVDYIPKPKEDYKVQIVYTKTIDFDVWVSKEEMEMIKNGDIPYRIDQMAENIDNEQPKEFGMYKIIKEN